MPNDLSINKIRFKSTVLIKSWPDTIENTTSIISSHFELQSLPKVGAFLIQKNMYIAALSPGHYMIISDHQDLYLKLSKILSSENAAVIDISESRRGLHLKGADAPLILNKEIAIDLSNKTTSDFAVIQSELYCSRHRRKPSDCHEKSGNCRYHCSRFVTLWQSVHEP